MDFVRPDTTPGFTMESLDFSLTFITGLQRGVESSMLRTETDWFDMMAILLSRLDDHPTNQGQFEVIASRCLEIWAVHQPGGEDLNLRIQVAVEERLYGKQLKMEEIGRCKAIRLTFNDPNTTQVFFEARKKLRMRRLKELAAAKTADQLPSLGSGKQLAAEGMIPAALVYDLTLAYLDTWTTRYSRQKLFPCCQAIHPRWKETCFCRGEERSKVLLSMRKKALQVKEKTETGTKEKTLKERLQEALRSFVKKRNQG